MKRPEHNGLISMGRLAQLMGDEWTTDTVRSFMKGLGIGKKRNGRYDVTRTQLRAMDADLAVEIEVAIAEGR